MWVVVMQEKEKPLVFVLFEPIFGQKAGLPAGPFTGFGLVSLLLKAVVINVKALIKAELRIYNKGADNRGGSETIFF